MTQFEHDEIQDLIDAAIRKAMAKHNRNATIISAGLGFGVLAFYTSILLTIVHRIGPPVR